MTTTAEERDWLGRVAYLGAVPWEKLTGWERDRYCREGEAVRAAVLAGDPFVAALWRLALAAYEISPLGESSDEDEFQEAVRAIVERPEWRQRQEQQ